MINAAHSSRLPSRVHNRNGVYPLPFLTGLPIIRNIAQSGNRLKISSQSCVLSNQFLLVPDSVFLSIRAVPETGGRYLQKCLGYRAFVFELDDVIPGIAVLKEYLFGMLAEFRARHALVGLGLAEMDGISNAFHLPVSR
jgi:hypothetical protein